MAAHFLLAHGALGRVSRSPLWGGAHRLRRNDGQSVSGVETIADRAARGFRKLTVEQAAANYRAALEAGLLKIISKMGISVISSYRGGLNFEAIGLSRALVDEFFPGMTSRISGIGSAGIALEAADQHARAYDETLAALPMGGFYRFRSSGERHALESDSIHNCRPRVIAATTSSIATIRTPCGTPPRAADPIARSS